MTQPGTADRTVVTDPWWVTTLMWAGFPVAGAAVVWAVSRAAAWLAGQDWAPWQGVFRLVAGIPEPWATLGALVVGLIAGLVLAAIGAHESLVVTITPDEVTLGKEGRVRTVPSGRVATACMDRKELVLLSEDGAELAREKTDVSAAAYASAFTAAGHRWSDADPYAAEFKRWVDGAPGLPEGAGALLKARAEAIEKNDRDDRAELGDELAAIGVAVRDEKKRQYWRPAGRP